MYLSSHYQLLTQLRLQAQPYFVRKLNKVHQIRYLQKTSQRVFATPFQAQQVVKLNLVKIYLHQTS